jgi:hypothetical protein
VQLTAHAAALPKSRAASKKDENRKDEKRIAASRDEAGVLRITIGTLLTIAKLAPVDYDCWDRRSVSVPQLLLV